MSLRCDVRTKEALSNTFPIYLGVALQDSKETYYDIGQSLTLSAKAVSSFDKAIWHINLHGSHHTDVILSSYDAVAEHFLSSVDSAGVLWNTSTRMTNGIRYGKGQVSTMYGDGAGQIS